MEVGECPMVSKPAIKYRPMMTDTKLITGDPKRCFLKAAYVTMHLHESAE